TASGGRYLHTAVSSAGPGRIGVVEQGVASVDGGDSNQNGDPSQQSGYRWGKKNCEPTTPAAILCESDSRCPCPNPCRAGEWIGAQLYLAGPLPLKRAKTPLRLVVGSQS